MSNEKEIKEGNVVFLKSDSIKKQPMTVEAVLGKEAACIWFDNAEIKRSRIMLTALRPLEE